MRSSCEKPKVFIDLGADRVGVEMHRIEPPCQDGGERCLPGSGQPITKSLRKTGIIILNW